MSSMTHAIANKPGGDYLDTRYYRRYLHTSKHSKSKQDFQAEVFELLIMLLAPVAIAIAYAGAVVDMIKIFLFGKIYPIFGYGYGKQNRMDLWSV